MVMDIMERRLLCNALFLILGNLAVSKGIIKSKATVDVLCRYVVYTSYLTAIIIWLPLCVDIHIGVGFV